MNKSRPFFIFCLAVISILVLSCEKEITVDLPEADPLVVVEGSITESEPPLVLLTWSQGYFDVTDVNTFQNLFVHDAVVTITVDGTSYTLDELCTDDLTEEQLAIAAEALGVPVATIHALHLCVYTSFALLGETGKLYTINVTKDNHHVSGVTKIPELVYINDLHFEVVSTLPDDSLGFIFGNLTDPDTIGNGYRWYAKRISHYPAWVPDTSLIGEQKDFRYIAPLGSVFDDEFFNGLTFDFEYYRGSEPNSSKFDERNNERGYFKRGDTVAVKGCTIDRACYKYLYDMETQVSNQGNPFAVPFNPKSNLNGGLGAFIGYGAIYDTVVCE